MTTTDLANWLTAVWDEEEREFLKTLSGSRLWGKVTARRLLTYIIRDRKILAEHRAEEVVSIEPETRGRAFLVCHRCRTGERQLVWPCTTVRLLAAPLADRPDFRSEWLVERQGVEQ